MASCQAPEFPAVLVALEHLEELNRRLRQDELPFSAECSGHLTAMAAAVSELDASRRAAREHLEVETIKSSNLRLQIKNMSDRLSEDIMADRAAVRASNAEEMEQLRRDLATSSQIQKESEKKLQELLEQDKVLQLKRDEVKGMHEVAIATLNDQMSLRYSRQQGLEQKLEQIEELRSSTAAAKQEKASVLQNMALARSAFSEEQENWCRKVEEIEGEIRQQRNVISRIRRELEEVNGRKDETDSCLKEFSVQMVQLESNLERLKASRSYCEHQLQEEASRFQELGRQMEMLQKERDELEDVLSLKVQKLKEQIRAVEVKLQEGQSSGLLLKDRLDQISKVFRCRIEKEKEVRADYLCVSLQLERSGLQLEERITSNIRHSSEIMEMERQIQELQEDGKIKRRVFESRMEELHNDLDAVKSDIGHIKEEIKEASVFLKEEKIRQEEYEMRMTSDICNTRERYEKLLKEESTLLQLHPQSAEPDSFIELRAQNDKELKEIQNIHQQEVEQITAETEKIYRSIEEKQKELDEREKMLEQVEAKWSKVKKRHDELSDLNTELNRRRSELELSIQDTEEQTRILLKPRDNMKAELEDLLESFTDMLSYQNRELRAVEESIYKHKVMLERIKTQNSRIRLCSRELVEDLCTCRQETERYQEEVQEFNLKAKALLQELEGAWKRDVSVIKDGERSDDVLLVSMNSLLNQLKNRNQQLMSVGTLLHQVMVEFSRRLGDKAGDRQHE
ncbi:PREDICTED: trichohyalin-like [Cyprinodon variegatus]|uniref:trichohyalin-like n=1 Tax=Cyprinodon variegatus TaxID=28743 RepID=UPI000742B014|nr:PREDICTED: trichohyalin-like [Cyprinodon variegatus]